jgi:hypothetical protein
MVMNDAWDKLSINKDGANAVKEIVLHNRFWSQVRYELPFNKPIYHMIKFANSNRPIIREVYE